MTVHNDPPASDGLPAAKADTSADARMRRTDVVLALVRAEVERAARKHPSFNSHHEGYAVLLEEVDELWDDIKKDRHDPATEEAVQVAAMAVRLITDCGRWTEVTKIGTWPLSSVLMLSAHHEKEKVAARRIEASTGTEQTALHQFWRFLMRGR